MSDLRELYQQVILDHNKSPRNFRAIDGAHREAHGHNPLCGDRLTVYVVVENDKIADVAFKGMGCAISTASASLMTQGLMGKTVAEAKEIFAQFHALVTGEDGEKDKLGKLEVLGGVCEFPVRVKCATLAWHTLNNALDQSENTATTE